MSDEINVLSKTQIINVDPVSGSVSIVNAGPAGPAGGLGLGATTALTDVHNDASGTITLDLSTYQSFQINMTGNTVLAFANPPASPLFGAWRIKVTGVHTLGFSGTIRYPGGVQPTYQTPSEYALFTDEGSTPIYYLQQVGSAFS